MIEKEEKFKQECTFKPKINPIPSTKNLDYKPKKFDRDEWFKSLSRPRTEIIEQRERQKREKEEEDNKNNSFRPSISSFHSIKSQLTVEERLFNCASNKMIKREQLKREKDELEASAFPYSPQVSDSVAVLIDNRKTQPPVYKRILEVQQESLNLKKIARENNEKSENNTFRPYISPNSRKLAASKCFGDVTERLSRDPSHYKEKPSESSVSFTSTSSKPYSAKEFLSRQQDLYEKSKQRKVKSI